MDIDISKFFETANAFEYSASIAERGANAGPETWANAKDAAKDSPLLTTPKQLDALRAYMKNFGAWPLEEIATWDSVECNALFIQLVSGDMREGGIDNNPDETEWVAYEKGVKEGRWSGNIFRDDDRIFYSLSH